MAEMMINGSVEISLGGVRVAQSVATQLCLELDLAEMMAEGNLRGVGSRVVLDLDQIPLQVTLDAGRFVRAVGFGLMAEIEAQI